MSWEKDFPIGKEKEREVREYFGQFFEVEESVGKAQYDLSIKAKLEVKFDQKATTTGNFAIEIYFRGKQSGLSITEARSWVLCTEEGCWLMPTTELKRIVKIIYTGKKLVPGGDNNEARLALIPYSTVKLYQKLELSPF